MLDLLDSQFWATGFESIYTWTMLLPIVVGLYTRGSHNAMQSRLLLYVIISFVFEYFAQSKWALQQFEPRTNAPYYHFFVPILFCLFVQIYQDLFRGFFGPKGRYLCMFFFILFSIWNAVWGDGILFFPSKSLGLYAFLMMSISISYFLKLMTTLELDRLEREPAFWVSAGVLVYFSGNFLLWLTMNYFIIDKGLSSSIYKIISILGLLLNVLFTIAFLCRPKAVLPIPTQNRIPHGN